MSDRPVKAPGEFTLTDAWKVYKDLNKLVTDHVVGHDESISTILTAFFGGGHVLLEDYPGSGKSYLAEWLGNSIWDDVREDLLDEGLKPALNILPYNRIQCTPDLLPSDITGYTMPEQGSGKPEEFRRGSVFAYVVLLDEINRTTPKVQSAMLEAMAERKVTVDAQPHNLGKLFFVIATQNPLDHKGTYELPAAQLDRFLFKVTLKRMTRPEVRKVMTTQSKKATPVIKVSAIVKTKEAIDASMGVDKIAEGLELLLDIRDAIEARVGKELYPESIPSARSLQGFIGALKVAAFVRAMSKGAELQVEVEDIRLLAPDFFRHRVYPCEARDLKAMDKLVSQLVNDGLEMNARNSRPK